MDHRKTLLELLSREDINAVCGGKGTCGKCRVRVMGQLSPVTDEEKEYLTEEELKSGIRLACMTYPEGEYKVISEALKSAGEMQIQTKSLHETEFAPEPLDGEYGIAADIGTTTVAVYLCDLTGCRIEKTAAFRNPQGAYGADVITRIGYITEKRGGTRYFKECSDSGIKQCDKQLQYRKAPYKTRCHNGKHHNGAYICGT